MVKETILVIDDEKDVQKLLRYNLEKEGYRVLTAETGEQGFELARSAKPAAILLDLMLPELDGLEVCRLLKSSADTKHIPVLMLTAKSGEVDQVVGLELGAADYVTKPFSVKVLVTRLKNALKRPEKEPAGVLACCGVTLDRDRHSVTADGKEAVLTKIELGILSCLMEHPEVVISRERLVQRVWGSGALVSNGAVNMHMKSLRKKLRGCRDYLETVRGSGFRFC